MKHTIHSDRYLSVEGKILPSIMSLTAHPKSQLFRDDHRLLLEKLARWETVLRDHLWLQVLKITTSRNGDSQWQLWKELRPWLQRKGMLSTFEG